MADFSKHEPSKSTQRKMLERELEGNLSDREIGERAAEIALESLRKNPNRRQRRTRIIKLKL